jgi:hypothetical protein
MSNPRIGSTFDSDLEEGGIRDEVEALAQKRVLAWELEKAKKESLNQEGRNARVLGRTL